MTTHDKVCAECFGRGQEKGVKRLSSETAESRPIVPSLDSHLPKFPEGF